MADVRAEAEKNPALFRSGVCHKAGRRYRLARLEALSGLILASAFAVVMRRWVARLQWPSFHFMVGSGQAVQYYPEGCSMMRWQPSHASTTSRQDPPL